MPRTVLRQFTGGISNEIDAQNLRDDQGEEAIDINLKGFALEPGEGVNPLTDAGHYYYRGEWIKDSAAVSFEESGIGVIKTYDTKRPEFEEIINDKDNIARDLGPPLPPGAVITGTIVSEGTRGERPGDGAHLLELPAGKFGSIDTGNPVASDAPNDRPYYDAPSLAEHKATATLDADHIYYYDGKPYWVEKTNDTWNVKTRAWSGSVFTVNDIVSGNLTHNSSGSFFKDNYFICWDERYIDTVALGLSTLSVNTKDTISSTGGDCGSNFGFTDSSTHPATAKEISSVILCDGTITFTQKIQTADSTIAEYTNSSNERWILPRKYDSYILLLRDGQAYIDWNDVEAPDQGSFGPYYVYEPDVPPASDATLKESTGAYTEDSEFTLKTSSGEVATNADWIDAEDSIWTGHGGFGHTSYADTHKIGIKYVVRYLPRGEWACVTQTGTYKPEIIVLESRKYLNARDAEDVRIERTFSESAQSKKTKVRAYRGYNDDWVYFEQQLFRLKIHINMIFPKFKGSIRWEGEPIPEAHVRHVTGYRQTSDGTEANYGYTRCSHFRNDGKFHWSHRNNRLYAQVCLPSAQSGDHYTSDKGDRQFWRRFVRRRGNKVNVFGDGGMKRVYGKTILWNNNGITKNNITVPKIWGSGLIFDNTSIRLCNYSLPSGDITLKTHSGQSSIFTTATIAKADKSISFVQASTTNFTQGDNIMVGTSGDSTKHRKIGLNFHRYRSHFVARIKKIEDASPAGKLFLEPIPGYEDEFMAGVDEECYPIITTIDPYVEMDDRTSGSGLEFAKLVGTTRQLIRTELTSNILLGSSHGRAWSHIGDNEVIHVRNDVGAYEPKQNYSHKIKWQGRTTRAVNTSGTDLRIIYIDGGFLKSQNGNNSYKGIGLGGVSPTSTVFSNNGTVHLTSTLMTVTDNGGITVYDPSLNVQYVKGRPEKPSGLGLPPADPILDGFHVSNSEGTFIFVKYVHSDSKEYWKVVKTGSVKPETSLLSYNFIKPLEYDSLGTVWGTFKDDDGNYDLHTAVPFFESNITNSWINYSANNNSESAWGQVLKIRLSKADKNGDIKRWLSVDWKFDSGVWNVSIGDPVIGLAHETDRMTGANNEFTWYLLDYPPNGKYEVENQGTQIKNPKISIKFKSKIIRDIVFFQHTETVLPVGGATGAENRISFNNYSVAGQKFYVLNNNILDLEGTPPLEQAYQLGQADRTAEKFDASRVGRSTFLVGAPNMYNPYGPNIDFYYRASFIDKWNNESVPSPLPTEGISPLDSADDCIQVQLSPTFFKFDNTDITNIRLYRYGGDSSEFQFLKDIPIPTITEFPVNIPASGGFAASFQQKATTSPYYNLKTFHDISPIGDFTNSAFDLEATPSAIDGSWRVNQVYENEPRQTFLGVNDGNGGHLEIQTDAHGLANNDVVRVSSTGTLPGNLSADVYYYVVNKTTDTFNLSLADGGSPISHTSNGTPTHTWLKIGYETTLAEDLNETDTIVKLFGTDFPTSWPATGVIKLEEEYISYADITAGVATVGTIVSGEDHTYSSPYEFYNVPLGGGSGTGVIATVEMEDDFTVRLLIITREGTGYKVGDSLTIPNSVIGGAADATCVVATLATGVKNLTGCVRGYYGTDGSNHKSGYIESVTVNSAGTDWGDQIDNNVHKTDFRNGTFSNLNGNLGFTLSNTGGTASMAVGFSGVEFKSTGTLPKGIKENTLYKIDSQRDNTTSPYLLAEITGKNADGTVGIPRGTMSEKFPAGSIPVTDSDLGSGQATYNPNTFWAPDVFIRQFTGVNDNNGGYLEIDNVNSFYPPYGLNLVANERIRFVASGGVSGLSDTTPTPSAAWEASQSHTGVSQTSSSGTGGNYTASLAEFSIATDSSGNPTVTITSYGQEYIVNDTIIITDPGSTSNTATVTVSSITSVLPTGLLPDTDYYVKTVTDAGSSSSGAANGGDFTVSASINIDGVAGSEIMYTDGGTGYIWWYAASNLVGSGFYGRYEVNPSTGAITGTTIVNRGQGYIENPSQIVIRQDSGNSEGEDANISATVHTGIYANAVEWVLEMEHRNQDTTTLAAAITSNTVPSTIYVTNTDLFPSGGGKILIGNHIINYAGISGDTFTSCTHDASTVATTHSEGVLVLSYNETYTEQNYTGVKLEVNEFGYRDKARTPVMSLHSMKEDNWPPVAIGYNEELKKFYEKEATDDFFRYVTSVGSLYFGAVNADLRFSRYGSPEYWPIEAVVTLDSEIKGIMEHSGEGIVFTTNSVYRVRGTDPKAMVAFRVPDAKGIMDGDRHSISEFNGGIIWKTASDGICMYSAGRVSYLTRDKHNIPYMEKPYSCVSDGVYWLFQRPLANREKGDTGNGFRLEVTSGDLRLCHTSIQAYYAYFAKALGKAVVVTSDNSLSEDDTDFVVQEVGGTKAPNISWRSKKIDVGEPATAKAFGSIAIVYESLESTSYPTAEDGIRGQALAARLLSINPDDLDAGDLNDSDLDGAGDLYDVFTKYDSVGQEFIVDIGGTNWNLAQRKTIIMPVDFDTGSIAEGDSIWNDKFADNTKVVSVGTYAADVGSPASLGYVTGITDWVFTEPQANTSLVNGDLIHFNASTFPSGITADTNYYAANVYAAGGNHNYRIETEANKGTGVYIPRQSPFPVGLTYIRKILYPTIVLDNEPLRSGTGDIVWGNLPQVHIYLNNESTPSRSFTLPPIVSEEPQSADLYLDDLRRFRTISVKVEGNVRINTISLRHFPVQQFQSQTLHHSADIFYKGVVDFRVMLDGDLIYRKELANAGKEFTEERIYLPASSFGSRVHYMNESRNGMIESVTFNGSLAA